MKLIIETIDTGLDVCLAICTDPFCPEPQKVCVRNVMELARKSNGIRKMVAKKVSKVKKPAQKKRRAKAKRHVKKKPDCNASTGSLCNEKSCLAAHGPKK